MSTGYLFNVESGFPVTTVNKLATIPGINLKNTGQTTLFTVPTGYTAIITDVIVEITASSVFAIAATGRVGKTASYDEFIAATAFTGLSAVGNYFSLATASLLGIHTKFVAGEVIKLDITVGATATTLTGQIHVLGFLY